MRIFFSGFPYVFAIFCLGNVGCVQREKGMKPVTEIIADVFGFDGRETFENKQVLYRRSVHIDRDYDNVSVSYLLLMVCRKYDINFSVSQRIGDIRITTLIKDSDKLEDIVMYVCAIGHLEYYMEGKVITFRDRGFALKDFDIVFPLE